MSTDAGVALLTETLTAPRLGHWIGGRQVAPAGGQYMLSTSPLDRRAAYEVADGDSADVDTAAAVAGDARKAWAATTTAERSALLQAVAATGRAHLDSLVEAEIAETGKLELHARMELRAALDYYDYYAAVVRTLHGETIDQGPNQHTYVRHEPFGVVGVIAPWNGPVNQASRGIAPAIAAGNTVIVKPSEFTSAGTLRLAELASHAGLPDGVLNVVTGRGVTAGASLVRHPAVRRITFTGSVPAGQAIGRMAADRIIPLALELGGKSPIIVLADAPLDLAARPAAFAALANSGQVCSATTRLLVARSIQDELLDRVAAILRSKQPGTDFGPIITGPQFEKILGVFDSATADGARAVVGGHCYLDGSAARGRFIAPTLYRDVTPDMRIATDEIFGPVLVSLPFDTIDEAITLANDTPYGLAASIWTGDAARGIRTAHALEAGQVSINGGAMTQETPFGGYKMSGYGREKGADAIYEYTQTKSVSLALPSA